MPAPPEKPKSAERTPRARDDPMPDLASPPLTPEAEAKVKAGLGNVDGPKGGLTEN